MHIQQSPSFIHIHSQIRADQQPVVTLPAKQEKSEKRKNILIARIATDLLAWIDSAWIIGLIRSADDIDVIGVFSDTGDPALWPGYVDSISLCARAGTPALLDSQLRSNNLVRVLVPIETDGEALAILAVGPRNRNLQYSASDVCVMRELCGQAGNLLRARAAMRPELPGTGDDELETVRGMQDRLLPGHPLHISGLECCGQCERTGKLGGDFFDFSSSPSAGLIAAIGNVAAAGNPGCILMTALQACLRSLNHRGIELPDLFREVNLMFWEIAPENAHATLFAARVDPCSAQLHYVNAGHQTSLLVRQSGRLDRLEPNAAVLGLSRRSAYRQRTVPFGPGDTLIGLSDGIAEPARESAVVQMVQHDRGCRVRELPARIIDLVESIAAPRILDQTVVVVHFTCASDGGASSQLHERFAHPATAAA
jgi:sigma-B regulation protein RsbU (phosphoserine phosphatase)